MIDYTLLADALNYFTSDSCPFPCEYVDVPWIVHPRFTNITAPRHATGMFNTEFGDLVASAEQSFVSIASYALEKKKRYVAVTPCFREELVYDKLHKAYFMKIEQFYLADSPNDNKDLEFMYNTMSFCIDRFNVIPKIEAAPAENSSDIIRDLTINDIEIGSYGFRQYNNLMWFYGTGLAFPRITQALGANNEKT